MQINDDPEVSKRLVRIGGFVLFINVPAKCSIGIDLVTFTTGERFQGFKMVPPSTPHLIHWASREEAVRASLLASIEPGGAVVFRWNSKSETMDVAAIVSSRGESSLPGGITCEEDSEALAFANAAKRMALDSNLGPYPLDHLQKWRRMISHVSEESIERIRPLGGIIYADADAAFTKSLEVALKVEAVDAMISNTSTLPPSLYFSSISGCGPKSNPSHRTQYAIDTSFALVRLCRDLRKHGVPENNVAASILSELQLSFVLFFVGQSFSALEQWKRLVDVLCRSEDILLGKFRLGDCGGENEKVDEFDICSLKIASRPSLFSEAFSIIHSQVSEIPSDTPELTADSFLVKSFFALSRTHAQALKLKQSAAMDPCLDRSESEGQNSPLIINTSVSESLSALLSKSRSVLHWDDIGTIEEEDTSGSRGSGSGSGSSREKTDMETLLAQLAEDGGDGDLPEIVMTDGS